MLGLLNNFLLLFNGLLLFLTVFQVESAYLAGFLGLTLFSFL
jgi:hypothetical protein